MTPPIQTVGPARLRRVQDEPGLIAADCTRTEQPDSGHLGGG
jgi:hypothetical protein